MDKFFPSHDDIPSLPKERFEQMAELAMSHHQHVPGNENVRGRWAMPWSMKWVSALSAAACVVLMIGVMSVQTGTLPTGDTAPASVQTAQGDDAYSDITEIAILDTLGGY